MPSAMQSGTQMSLEDLQLKRERLERTWAQLNLTATLYMEMARFIDDSWPSFLRPATVDVWLESVNNYGLFVGAISDSVLWLNEANQLVLDGKAEYRASQTVPGDLDLWGNPDDFGPVPGRLLEAFAEVPGESTTLGAVATGTVVLIAIGIIGATASIVSISMAVIEQTRTRREAIRSNLTTITIRAIEAGAISESFGNRILKTIDVWTKAEAAKPLLEVDTSGVLTVAAVGGIGYLLYRWLKKPEK